jgi:hypothetical protein
MLFAALLGLYGCGGGGSSSGGGSGGMNEITWPVRGGGMTSELPPALKTGQVVFESATESCCVAVNPSLLSGSAQSGLAILNDLPAGPATVTVAGYTTDFAPAIPDITKTCSTVPASAAMPCDPTRVAAPAFISPVISVNIIAGAQTSVGDVPMSSLPFLFDFTPAQDSDAPAPVQFALTLTDATTGIAPSTVALEVSFTMPDTSAPTGSPFRTISKRVALTLAPCNDGTGEPCSAQGNLDLAGFNATGTAPELPEGQVEAHVTAENLANPPNSLDFRYSFNVLATPTATATGTPTTASSLEGATPSAPGGAAVAGSAATAATSDAGTAPAAASGSGSQNEAPPTPTATPTPGGPS